jgi:hypothetical protein
LNVAPEVRIADAAQKTLIADSVGALEWLVACTGRQVASL